MATKIVVPAGAFLAVCVVLIVIQQWMFGGPVDWLLSKAPPVGTNGVVSTLTLIGAVGAIFSGKASGREFVPFALTLLPSIVVLYGGLYQFWHFLPVAGRYLCQCLALLLAVFVYAGLTKKFEFLNDVGIDKELHMATFWTFHGLGAIVSVVNLWQPILKLVANL